MLRIEYRTGYSADEACWHGLLPRWSWLYYKRLRGKSCRRIGYVGSPWWWTVFDCHLKIACELPIPSYCWSALCCFFHSRPLRLASIKCTQVGSLLFKTILHLFLIYFLHTNVLSFKSHQIYRIFIDFHFFRSIKLNFLSGILRALWITS